MQYSIVILTITLLVCFSSAGTGWTYTDLSTWPDTCLDNSQSPINVQRQSTVYDKDLRNLPLTLEGFDLDTDSQITVNNNGHTVVFSLDGGEVKSITGGKMMDTVYLLKQLHFHWGKDDTVGSEHTIDGQSYPLEMHMVFMRSDFSNFTQALPVQNSLAVLGTMFEIGEFENKDYADLISKLSGVKYTNKNTSLTGVKLGSLLPNHNYNVSTLSEFYTYPGSLTTPPCSEVVIWNLLPTTVKITKDQMQAFRTLTMYSESKKVNDISQGAIGFNYRPIQKMNGRIVKRSFEPYGFGAVRVVENTKNTGEQNNNINSAATYGVTSCLLIVSTFLYSLITV